MSTNFEKYLGLNVVLSEEMNPFTIALMREKAVALAATANFNIEDFWVYLHSMSIHKVRGHWSSKYDIHDKMSELLVKFKVNEKQKNNGKIRFFNAYIDYDLPQGVDECYGSSDTEVVRIYKGTMFKKQSSYKTHLITYLSKELRARRHKKVKVECEAVFNPLFEGEVRSRYGGITTNIDLYLKKDVTMPIIEMSISQYIETKMELYSMMKHSKSMKDGGVNILNVNQNEANPVISSQSNASSASSATAYSKQEGCSFDELMKSISAVLEIVSSSGLPDLDKEDVVEALHRIEDLAKKEPSQPVLKRVQERLNLVESIVGSTVALSNACAPYLREIMRFFM